MRTTRKGPDHPLDDNSNPEVRFAAICREPTDADGGTLVLHTFTY
jgi:hypothetical protein